VANGQDGGSYAEGCRDFTHGARSDSVAELEASEGLATDAGFRGEVELAEGVLEAQGAHALADGVVGVSELHAQHCTTLAQMMLHY